jgi:phosphate transport system protein
MPRESFHQELDRLVKEVVELGREVESGLDTMVETLENRDAEAASHQVGVDARYKERETQIAEECMILQARQAPVARDLRLIHVVQAVTNHLVRTGTLCEHICQGIAETRDAERDPHLAATLQEMAHSARDLFRRGLDVFETRDVQHSEELEEADDRVDLMYSEGMNLAVNPGDKERVGSPEWRVRAALTVHYLERIADHGVDIGERTVFLVTGERMESALREYRERRVDDYED